MGGVIPYTIEATMDAIRDAADPAGIFDRPLEELAMKRGVDVKTLQRHIEALKDEGRLIRIRRGLFKVADWSG